MRIGELARKGRTLVETIRFYEQARVLPAPPRTARGYRQYGPMHVQRLVFVRRCRELGFSLDEVRSLLTLADRTDDSCASVTRIASDHLQEVRRKLADLKRLERALVALNRACDGGQMESCRILETLKQGN